MAYPCGCEPHLRLEQPPTVAADLQLPNPHAGACRPYASVWRMAIPCGLDTHRRHTEIWTVPAAGGVAPRALITSERNDNTARWAPDGSKIAFLSTRDGSSQVWIAAADGTAPRKLTNIAGGAQPPLVWSPDGSRIAFVADVYPDCADNTCNKVRMENEAENPVQARQVTRLFFRHWEEWQIGRASCRERV